MIYRTMRWALPALVFGCSPAPPPAPAAPALSTAMTLKEVMAWVKLRPGMTATEDELATFCRGRISTFKIPRYWKFVDAFPMTVTGKVQKFLMREVAVEELGLGKAADMATA